VPKRKVAPYVSNYLYAKFGEFWTAGRSLFWTSKFGRLKILKIQNGVGARLSARARDTMPGDSAATVHCQSPLPHVHSPRHPYPRRHGARQQSVLHLAHTPFSSVRHTEPPHSPLRPSSSRHVVQCHSHAAVPHARANGPSTSSSSHWSHPPRVKPGQGENHQRQPTYGHPPVRQHRQECRPCAVHLCPLQVYSHDLLVDSWVIDLLEPFCAFTLI
jgi:hypothetical protein